MADGRVGRSTSHRPLPVNGDGQTETSAPQLPTEEPCWEGAGEASSHSIAPAGEPERALDWITDARHRALRRSDTWAGMIGAILSPKHRSAARSATQPEQTPPHTNSSPSPHEPNSTTSSNTASQSLGQPPDPTAVTFAKARSLRWTDGWRERTWFTVAWGLCCVGAALDTQPQVDETATALASTSCTPPPVG